ncbi:FAS1 domain-containing protein [Mrakia frigida]|uniref:FAS1 domain-containing protein n=1 Tax=Mrakia frigida TaxID=29902 RepID=UPI003FCC101A
MRSGFIALAAAGVATVVSAQAQGNDTMAYATGLFAALDSVGLTYLSGVIAALPQAGAIAQALMSSNNTVLAPSNAAFASALNFTDTTLDDTSALDLDLLYNVITYHVLAGTYLPSDLGNGTHIVASTLLSDDDYVNLPGNATQVVVLEGMGGANISIAEANSRPMVVGNATYENVQLYVIDTVLTVPGDISSVASNIAVLAETLTSFDLVETLDNIVGITIFAPQDSALTAALPALSELNATVATAVLANHVINGTVGYSSVIMDGMALTSASGQALSIIKNDTGVFVVSGEVTAQVLRADVPIKNGVVHIIDSVLLNTASNPEAAESAASVAATATATMGPAATGGSATESAGAAASSAATGAASALRFDFQSVHGLLAAGVVAGALAVLA